MLREKDLEVYISFWGVWNRSYIIGIERQYSTICFMWRDEWMGMDCQSIFSDIYPRKRRADMLLRLNVSVFRKDHPYLLLMQ